MISKVNKNEIRKKRHLRVRNKISGTPERPRLSVFRSNKQIYAQLIDDVNGVTLAAASSLDATIKEECAKLPKLESATLVGKEIAKNAKENNISECVFDRGGYVYEGRVKALAEGAREAGLEF